MSSRLLVSTSVIALSLSFLGAPTFAGYVTVYDEDFSSDPGWVTNDPTNLYWDGATETYHAWQANTNTSYAYKEIVWDGESFLMEWDLLVNSVQWSAGATFGLFDPQLLYGSNSVTGDFSLVDGGYGMTIDADNGADRAHDTTYVGWQTGLWYENAVTYDADTGDLQMEIRRRDTGELIATLNDSIVGPFPGDIDLIGVSRLHIEGYTNNAVDFNLDNVRFSVVPEPATLSLLFLGGIAALRRRR